MRPPDHQQETPSPVNPGPPSKPLLVHMRGMGKRFGPVTVLRGVDLEIYGGEVHILAGENGAGKSTLIKILGGVYSDFDGEIAVGGRTVRPQSPLEANALGIAVIYQELSLIPSLTVADNIFLGHPLTRGGFIDDRAQLAQAQALLNQLGLDIDGRRRVEDLPIALQQLTEIAKALARQARVIVMDEPTSSLNAPEVETLFALIQDLKNRGCGLVYITHKMEEIQRVGDRITVLRDGQQVGTAPAAELPPAKLVRWMVGREIQEQFPRHAAAPGPERLRVADFRVRTGAGATRWAIDGVSFSVRAGEIVGLAGLQGSGASELLLGLFGALGDQVAGQVWINGCPVRLRQPQTAIQQGLALVTNDRKASGLVLSLSIIANATLAHLISLSPGGWLRPRRELATTRQHAQQLSLRASSLALEVAALSGGNQQKVVLAKWLETQPQVLLLDEPTRGVDVGAKRDIYELMNTLTGRGLAMLLITSELPELLAMSDRIIVLHRGRITAEYSRTEATADRILAAAMGGEAGKEGE